MATLSFFVALSGVGIAATAKKNSVTSKSVKNESLVGADVKNGSLTRADLAQETLQDASGGAVGAQGPQGPEGPRGPEGPQGPQGPADGPAGGDLSGSYPNPAIAANAIGSPEVAADSLTGADVNESTLSGVNAATLGGLPLRDVNPDLLRDSENPSPDTDLAATPTTVLSIFFANQFAAPGFVIGSIDLYSTTATAQATCQLFAGATAIGQRVIADFDSVNDNEQVPIAVSSGIQYDGEFTTGGGTPQWGPTDTLELRCEEDSGSVRFERGDMHLILLS